MIKIIVLIMTVILFTKAEAAQLLPKEFRHLSRLDAGESIGGSKGIIFIYYNTKISKILKYQIESSDHPGVALRAIETKLDSTSKDKYIIDYDAGPSGDPHFIIYRKENTDITQVGSYPGTQLIVPGDGSIYVSGEANDFFDKRRKYFLNGKKLEEVRQPYYYVGLKTTNTQAIDVYGDRSYQNKVAHLPSNSDVEVLIAIKKAEYNYDYLIKSPFGLVGWATAEGQYGQCGTELFKGICFHGD